MKRFFGGRKQDKSTKHKNNRSSNKKEKNDQDLLSLPNTTYNPPSFAPGQIDAFPTTLPNGDIGNDHAGNTDASSDANKSTPSTISAGYRYARNAYADTISPALSNEDGLGGGGGTLRSRSGKISGGVKHRSLIPQFEASFQQQLQQQQGVLHEDGEWAGDDFNNSSVGRSRVAFVNDSLNEFRGGEGDVANRAFAAASFSAAASLGNEGGGRSAHKDAYEHLVHGQSQRSRGATNELISSIENDSSNLNFDNLSSREREQWAPIPEDPHPNLQLQLGHDQSQRQQQLPIAEEQGQLKSQQQQLPKKHHDMPFDSLGPPSSSASSSSSGQPMSVPTNPSSTIINPSHKQTKNSQILGNDQCNNISNSGGDVNNNKNNSNSNDINFQNTHDHYNCHSSNNNFTSRNASIVSPQHSQLSRQSHSRLTPHSQYTTFSESTANKTNTNQNYPYDNGDDGPTNIINNNNKNNAQPPVILQPDAIYVEHYGDAYVDELIKYLYPTGYQSMRPRSGPWKLSIFIFLLFLWLSVFIVGHCYDRGQREYNYYFGNDDDAYLEEVDDDTLVMETRWCGSKMLYFMWIVSVSITILAMSYCSIIGYVKVRDVAVANGRSLFPGMENTVAGKAEYVMIESVAKGGTSSGSSVMNASEVSGSEFSVTSSYQDGAGGRRTGTTRRYVPSIYQADGTPQFWGGHIYRPTQAAVALSGR